MTQHLYPEFMLCDTNAKELGLTLTDIESYVSHAKQTEKNIFYLYYKRGLNYNAIHLATGLPKTKLYSSISKIKKGLIELSKIKNNGLTLIVGRSGTGKSTLEQFLVENYQLSTIKSYTTRPKRSENEDNHIFIKESQYNDFKNKIATTEINGFKYFATKEQLDKSQLYVIDPKGLYELVENYPNLKFNLIYIKLSKQQHQTQLKTRRLQSNETLDSQEKRLDSENNQFTEFEDKLKNKTLPSNLEIIDMNKLIPNYRKENRNV